MQCVCGAVGAAAGWGQPQPQRPHRQTTTSKKQKFLRVRPLCRNLHKKTKRCGILRLSRTKLENRLKGKFWCGQNLPFGQERLVIKTTNHKTKERLAGWEN